MFKVKATSRGQRSNHVSVIKPEANFIKLPDKGKPYRLGNRGRKKHGSVLSDLIR